MEVLGREVFATSGSVRRAGRGACSRNTPRSGRYPRVTSMPKLSTRESPKKEEAPVGDPCREVDLVQKSPQDTSFWGRTQEAAVRALRPRRDLAGPPNVDDPRPHQWRSRRPPNRESASCLPQLRRDSRYTLRAQESNRARRAALPALRARLHSRLREPALLLTYLWRSLGSVGVARSPCWIGGCSEAPCPKSRASAVRPAAGGDRQDELPGSGSKVRGFRQCGAQVGSLLRATGRTGGR